MPACSKDSTSKMQPEQLVEYAHNGYFKRKAVALSMFDLRISLQNQNPYLFMINGFRASEIVEHLINEYIEDFDTRIFDASFPELIRKTPDFNMKLMHFTNNQVSDSEIEYIYAWNAAKNRFTAEFVQEFCLPDGHIDWEKLTRFVSERPIKPPKKL